MLLDTNGAILTTASPLDRWAALVVRERKTRFSGGALSSLWAFVTPVGWIVIVVLAFQYLGRAVPIHAPMALFVASGILPYAVFRQTISSLMRAVIANRYLSYIQPVGPADILLASALLELLNTIVLAVLLFGGMLLVLAAPLPADPLRVMLGLAVAWALGAGFGHLAATLGQWSDTLSRAIPLALRPMFWLSGVFFTATELGGQAQAALWWNPLFHAIEILREGFFLGYVSPISDAWYPLAVALGCYLAAVPVGRFLRARNAARHRI
jgi:ABC-type polysaccharide/polyol phosphate export permease